MRNVATLLVGLLWAGRYKNWMMRRLGHEVHPQAHLSMVLLRNVRTIRMGRNARLRAMSAYRNLVLLELGSDASIGSMNWCAGSPAFQAGSPEGASGVIRLEPGAAITSRHFIDCSGSVSLGAFATLAGVRTTVLSHSIDLSEGVQRCGHVSIGERAFVGAGVILLPGASVPDRSAVGAGSVVTATRHEAGHLIAGSPAVDRGPVGGAYFTRTIPRVGLHPETSE